MIASCGHIRGLARTDQQSMSMAATGRGWELTEMSLSLQNLFSARDGPIQSVLPSAPPPFTRRRSQQVVSDDRPLTLWPLSLPSQQAAPRSSPIICRSDIREIYTFLGGKVVPVYLTLTDRPWLSTRNIATRKVMLSEQFECAARLFYKMPMLNYVGFFFFLELFNSLFAKLLIYPYFMLV